MLLPRETVPILYSGYGTGARKMQRDIHLYESKSFKRIVSYDFRKDEVQPDASTLWLASAAALHAEVMQK